jgi:glucuronate isomerase
MLSGEEFLSFIDDNFLLHGETARKLYHDFAASEPILDFHSHLPAAEIADGRRFRALTQIGLMATTINGG